MNEGEEVRKGKSVFRSVILLMAVVFAVMAGNIGIYAAQVGETNGNDTTEIVNPTVTTNCKEWTFERGKFLSLLHQW